MRVAPSTCSGVGRQRGLPAVLWPAQAADRCRIYRSHWVTRAMNDKYNHPALYSNDDAFWDRSYWDRRYEQDPTTFEWYRDYKSLQPVITQHLPKDKHILQIGVGTSRLQVDMADDGYSLITNTDYSPVAIQRLQHMYPTYNNKLRYAVADARSMPQYADASFSGVLDKGALDALLCGDGADGDAAAVVGEVWRLLTPGGAYVMITSASPRSRLQYLQQSGTPWCDIRVYEVGQQGAINGPYQCVSSKLDNNRSSSGSISRSSAILQQLNAGMQGMGAGDQAGSQSQLEAAMKLPLMGYSHLVYVCYKP